MKRLFLVFFFVTISIIAFAVDNLFTGATNSNWGTNTNWTLSSDGSHVVPTATDGYVTLFNATSPNCTVDGGSRVANHIDFSSYTNTITMTNQIRIYGNITLGAGMHVSGTSALIAYATGDYLSNGFVWPNLFLTGTLVGIITTIKDASAVGSLSLTTNGNITLQANLTVLGDFSFGNTGSVEQINGAFNVYVGGNLTQATTGSLAGTATIVMNGTGTWSNSSAGQLRNNLTINTAGTITILGNVYYNTGTLTNTASTLVTTGSTLNLGTCTLNMGDATLAGLTINTASAVVTLSSGVKLSGQLSSSVTGSSIISNSAGVQRKLTMLATSTQSISATNNIDATDIDSGDGLPIISAGGVLSNTNNWYSNAGTLTNMFMSW